MKTRFYCDKNAFICNIQSNIFNYLLVICLFTFMSMNNLTFGQTTVFTDNFNSTGLTNGKPLMTWVPGTSLTNGTGTAIIEVANGNLAIYNDDASPIIGRVWISGTLSTFCTPFNTTLNSNVGDVIWGFNMQCARGNALDGFANGKYGTAVVLAATSFDFSTANGYAVVLSKGTTTNALRLVSFTNGLTNTNSTTIIGPSADISANNNVQNVKVVYTPSTNKWKFYSFDTEQNKTTTSDPMNADVVQISTATVNNLYTSTPMTHCGFVVNIGSTSTGSNSKMKFDNFSVIVGSGSNANQKTIKAETKENTLLKKKKQEEEESTLNEKNKKQLPKLDLYLCIGQSNMAGRGYLTPELMDTMTNVYLFNDKGEFERAVNPLNRYSTIRKELSMQQLGPSYSFAKEIVKKTGHAVGLVVNARGGSSISSWVKGNKDGYYEEAVKRISEAMKYGDLKAILWHQGEANVSSPDKYKEQLIELVSDLRKDLKKPNLFFVAGELSQWNWTKNETGTTQFNKMIRSISSFIPYSACVSSENLTPLKDQTDPHFNSNSQLILGKRYSDIVLENCYRVE